MTAGRIAIERRGRVLGRAYRSDRSQPVTDMRGCGAKGQTWLTLCIIGASLATWRWGPAAWKHVQILYWQRQCLNYIAGADEVAYDGVTVARPECWEQLVTLTGLQTHFVLYGGPPTPVLLLGGAAIVLIGVGTGGMAYRRFLQR